MEPDAVEIRVLGCLIEKQHTTPDAYPLSLNALRLACNQSTNRELVVDYDEQTVVEALRRLALRGWTRLASGAGSRARKYRHLLDQAFGLEDAEVCLLAVLMLRGPQTPGELKQRGQRLHDFADLSAGRRRSSAWSSETWSLATLDSQGRRRIATSSCSAAGRSGRRAGNVPRSSLRVKSSLLPRTALPAWSVKSPSCETSSQHCAPSSATEQAHKPLKPGSLTAAGDPLPWSPVPDVNDLVRKQGR
ncbi:MAG: uncharacterized protein QOF13_109 [Solirubrobacterales bacterium]|jgi:hypothetical protein|nr:uncharacterized protein [Solirubrobacterales bacterium]